MYARVAWAVVAVTTLATVADTAFTAAQRPLLSEATWADHGWPLAHLANLGCALMGALIVSRYPRHLLGWLLSAASLLSVTLAAEAYSIWVLDGDGPGSPQVAHLAAWAGPLVGWPAFTALIMVFLIAPDGHLASPRWRWAVWVTVAGLGLHTVGTLTIRPGDFVYGPGEPGYRSISGPILTVGYLLVAAGLIASVASMAVRLRRARDDERRQLLWIASSAALLAAGVVIVLVIPRITGVEGTWLAGLPLRLAQLAVPICVAVAVLRHRLLAIDLIVNRALLLALATVMAGAGYVVVVVAVSAVVGGGITGFVPSVLASALVALAFQPLRSRVVTVADRLAFGSAAAPYEALADFSRRLGESPDPAVLLPTVADSAAHAVNASGATALLHGAAGPDRSAVWPPGRAPVRAASGVEVPVVDQGERLGSITVTMPAGHPLRDRERRLLADLADQAGMAFRSAKLSAELSDEVRQLGHRTDELAHSRRRLISTGDAERSRLEQAIAQQVVPHLAGLPDRLRHLAQPERPDRHEPKRHEPEHHESAVLDAMLLGPLTASLGAALQALQEITRGVYPAQLARSGLPIALGSLLARTGSTGRLVVEDAAAGQRFDPRVEGAAYFCVAEAARSFGDPVVVVLSTDAGHLRVVVSGDGRGDLPLNHIRDRVEAAGGSVSITGQGSHTVIELRTTGE